MRTIPNKSESLLMNEMSTDEISLILILKVIFNYFNGSHLLVLMVNVETVLKWHAILIIQIWGCFRIELTAEKFSYEVNFFLVF